MWWNKIIEWFSNSRERNKLLGDFNAAAKQAFVMNVSPVFLKAESSRGNSRYKHQFSNFFYHGFRIHILSGRNLTYSEVMDIGNMLVSNSILMRQLVTLGYDTLEITDINGDILNDWQLTTLLALE